MANTGANTGGVGCTRSDLNWMVVDRATDFTTDCSIGDAVWYSMQPGVTTVTIDPTCPCNAVQRLGFVNETNVPVTIVFPPGENPGGVVPTTLLPGETLEIGKQTDCTWATIDYDQFTDITRIVQPLTAGNNLISHPLNVAPREVEVRNDATGAIISARVVAETTATLTLFVPVAVASARISLDV